VRRIMSSVLRMSPAGWILAGGIVALGFYISAYQRQASEACAIAPESIACGRPSELP
jgi:hypothetical protein